MEMIGEHSNYRGIRPSGNRRLLDGYSKMTGIYFLKAFCLRIRLSSNKDFHLNFRNSQRNL